MPLLDHFHPPLSTRRHWHSFHNAWATYLADDLNQLLPEGYFAEPNAQFGIEIDVATFSEERLTPVLQTEHPTIWMPRSPTATVPFPVITDIVEVQVFSHHEGPELVGAIELVSPANKDRPAHRDAFTSKCQTYLQQGVGLIVIDVVTTLSANLHSEMMHRLQLQMEPLATNLYAIAYHVTTDVTSTIETPLLEIWQEAIALDQPLPTLPLYLKGGCCLPIDLEKTYQFTCTRQRIPHNRIPNN
jgi:hypothetical protein